MISRTVTFTDFNDKQQTKTYWFHLSRDAVFENLDLETEFERLEEQFGGDKRELSKDEIMQILRLVKRMFRLSYGERSADGSRFKAGFQFPEVWDDFVASPDYDAVLWDLFTHPKDLFPFLHGIMPKDLRDEAQKQIEEQNARKQPQDHLSKHSTQVRPVDVVEAGDPAAIEPQSVFETVPSEVVPAEETEVERLKRQLAEAEAAQQG